jgi:hypothetical protein
MKSMALNDCWNVLQQKGVNDFWGFLSLEDIIGNICMLVCEVTGEGFSG